MYNIVFISEENINFSAKYLHFFFWFCFLISQFIVNIRHVEAFKHQVS